jgi:hypothetical protein
MKRLFFTFAFLVALVGGITLPAFTQEQPNSLSNVVEQKRKLFP